MDWGRDWKVLTSGIRSGLNAGKAVRNSVNQAKENARIKKHNHAVAFAQQHKDAYLNHLIGLAKAGKWDRIPGWARLKMWAVFGPPDEVTPEQKLKAEGINIHTLVHNYLFNENFNDRQVKLP